MGNKEQKQNRRDRQEINFLVFGIGLIVFGCLIKIFGYSIINSFSLTQILESLSINTGIILIVLALVESKHLRRSLEHTSRGIVEASANQLEEKFDKSFTVIEHAKYNGLKDILAPRLDENMGKNTRAIIGKEIQKSKNVFIFSISGLGFFGYQHGGGVPPESDSIAAILNRITLAKNEGKDFDLEIKALLMNPESNAAKFRNEIETLAGYQGSIEADIDQALKGIEGLHSYAGKKFIEYYLYDAFPQTNFVLTDNYVFIEPYHYAPTEDFTKELGELNLKATTKVTCCTGGRVPIFQFYSKSNMYVAMKHHFKSIWKANSKS